MKIATVVMLVLAIALGSVALAFGINSPQSPLLPDNTPTGNVTVKTDDKEALASISLHSLKLGSLAVVGTIDDEVYRLNDYSKFYRISADGISELSDVKTARITVFVSGEVCELDINYVEVGGRVVGGGKYEKVLQEQGVYSVKLSLYYTLTEMPSALTGREGEKLLLVGFSTNDYYSEAFAIDLNGGYSRNMFSQTGRTEQNSDGYVMVTDELVKSAGEYLYFFSSRLYDRESEGSSFNEYKNTDLFRTKNGEEELVAREVHHRYMSDLDNGSVCFVRSEYASMTYNIGSIPVTSFREMSFAVVHLDLNTMTETQVMQSDTPYSSGFKRFGNYLVRMSDEQYGTLEVYDMVKNESKAYGGMSMRSVLGFDVSDDGRYIAVGGSVATVSTVNQSICFVDTQSGQTVQIKGKGLFLVLDGLFRFIDDGYFINTSYDSDGEECTFRITEIDKIIETFKESVDD